MYQIQPKIIGPPRKEIRSGLTRYIHSVPSDEFEDATNVIRARVSSAACQRSVEGVITQHQGLFLVLLDFVLVEEELCVVMDLKNKERNVGNSSEEVNLS